MIIDTHTHFYDPSRPEGVPWPSPDEELLYRTVLPEHFLAEASPCGVTGTVVVEAACTVEDNQWILDMADRDPAIVGYVGRLESGTPRFAEQVERFAAHPVFRGIRAWGDLDGGFLEEMKLLADHNLVLDSVPADDEARAGFLRLARELPDLTLVIEHVANAAVDGGPPDPEWTGFIEAAGAHANVYMKVSALTEKSAEQPAPGGVGYYRPALDAMWNAFGGERLLYGSNWPVCERAAPYATGFGIVREYFEEKGSEAAERFFWKNARAAYEWPDR